MGTGGNRRTKTLSGAENYELGLTVMEGTALPWPSEPSRASGRQLEAPGRQLGALGRQLGASGR